MAVSQKRRIRIRRRSLLKGSVLGALAVPTVAALDALLLEPYWVETVREELPIRSLPDEFVGRTVAHITDLHCSRVVTAEYLNDCVEAVNALEPDLVVLTGDYITYQGRDGYHRQVIDVISSVSAPLGVHAVFGNHDVGVVTRFHAGSADLHQYLAEGLADVGVHVLENRALPLTLRGQDLWIAGLGDLWSGHFAPEDAFRLVPRKAACLGLVHNPDAVDPLARFPASALLAGHTHGGQVAFPLIGRPFLPIRNRQYYAGKFNVDGRTLYVNRGLGRIGRVRFNCRPEITLFTLARADLPADPKSHRQHQRSQILVP